jgi:SAM-dependent methyltransferase
MTAQYDQRFMDYADVSSRHSAEVISALIGRALAPGSVLDVGCARGTWLAAWQERGATDVQGIDGAHVDLTSLRIDRERFLAHDLSQPFDLGRGFDLVQSLEVAEHIPAERAQTFVDNLVRHARGAILFSAAPPGQGGEHHVNEQPYDYWRVMFAAHGYRACDVIRPAIASDHRISFWYRYNLLLYLDAATAARLPEWSGALLPEGQPIRDLSPLWFKARKQVIRWLPSALRDGLARAKAVWMAQRSRG